MEEFISNGKEHNISLKPGKYIFHEVYAPNGYETATDISFELTKEAK